MNRSEFLKYATALGLGSIALPSLLTSCSKKDLFGEDFDVNFDGSVLIIGAGAAGLIAGHILNQFGIGFQILEASDTYGGRVKKIDGFADFPIDLGAEWIHTNPKVLSELLNDPDSNAEIDFITYNPQTVSVWKNNKLRPRNFVSTFYSEHKFKSTTWFDFFEQYIVPNISNNIIYDSPVNEIDHSGSKVTVMTDRGLSYTADKVIVTVPLTILQNNSINFVPALPQDKTDALGRVDMPAGIKVFLEFSERFYPDLVIPGGLINSSLDQSVGEIVWYDAAFRKDSNRNVLGLFTVGNPATTYTDLETEQKIMEQVMSELDEMFDGKASQTYIKHVVQNWSAEPYIQGSYSHYESYRDGTLEKLAESIDDKVYFAGEAYSASSNATVHGAGQSSYDVLEIILKG